MRGGASAGLAAKIPWGITRFPREPGAVPGRTTAYDDMPYLSVFLAVFRVTRPFHGHPTIRLQLFILGLQQPGPGHGRQRPEHAAKRTQGIRDYMAAGHHERTEIGVRGGAKAAPAKTTSTSSLPALPWLKPARARVSLPPARNTANGELDTDTGRRLSVGTPRTCKNTSRTVVRLPGRRQGNGWNKALPAGATRATTLTRPLVVGGGVRCAEHSRSRR